MKLKNKKTGEIVERVDITIREEGVVFNNDETYNSLAELNKEWEDALEEPKDYWWISPVDTDVVHCVEDVKDEMDQYNKEIGNYFDSEEEAEKAVEKLKAWKRLKDRGFRFDGWNVCNNGKGITIFANYPSVTKAYLDLLFGGEE